MKFLLIIFFLTALLFIPSPLKAACGDDPTDPCCCSGSYTLCGGACGGGAERTNCSYTDPACTPTATPIPTTTPTAVPTAVPLPGCNAVCTIAAGCSSGVCTGTPFGNLCDCSTPVPTTTPTPTTTAPTATPTATPRAPGTLATPIPTAVPAAPVATAVPAAPVATAVPAAPVATTCGPYTCCTASSYGICTASLGPFFITCCAAGTTANCNSNGTGIICLGAPEPEACVVSVCNPSSTVPGCGSVSGGDNCGGACTYTYPWDCIAPWIQTTGGDVHSNTGINTPGGP